VGSAIIVGGGLAGLTCAWRLARAGHEVEVLESAPLPGGRMRGLTRDGFILDAACPVVFEGDANLRQLVASLGLNSSLHPLQSETAAIARNSKLHFDAGKGARGFFATPLLSARAKAQLLGVAAISLLMHRDLDPSRPARAEALDGDCFSRAIACRGAAAAEFIDALLEPLLCELHIEAAGECSRGFVLSQLHGRSRRGRRLSFASGPGVLVGALARLLPIRRECEVISVEPETDGVRVRYRSGDREGSVFADAAVVALPGSEVAGICPKLTPAERGFFERVGYVRGTTVHFLFERAPALPEGYRLAFPRSEDLGLRSVGIEHKKVGAAPPGAGLLAVELSESRAHALWELGNREVAQSVLATLERTPIGSLQATAFAVERRSLATPRFPPGALFRLARFENRLERSPRLAFAGDYLVGPGAEGAVTSGGRAANEIAWLI